MSDDPPPIGISPGLGAFLLMFAVAKTVGAEPVEGASTGLPTIPDAFALAVWVGLGLTLIVVPTARTYRDLQTVRARLVEHGVADVHEEGVR